MFDYDWTRVARLMMTSRALDAVEESELVPGGQVLYQFSAGGHELGQILLALSLDHPRDGASIYYRSRPFMLTLGLTPEDALRASMARAGGISDGRDVGVVFNRPGRGGVTVLPMSGDVGTQYTPAVGWAQAIEYHREVLGDETWAGAMTVTAGGDGSVATNGFWSALTIATTLRLPVLFLVEDNGFAISVRGDLQTPGRNIAANLASFSHLTVLDGDGTAPADAAANIGLAVSMVRGGEGPVLLRLQVPRLPGHSSVDNQAYKSDAERADELARDPLDRLYHFCVPERLSEEQWAALEEEVRQEVQAAKERALAAPEPAAGTGSRYVFFDGALQEQGGLAPEGLLPAAGSDQVAPPAPIRVNMVDAIRQVLIDEMALNPRLLIFGEDVGEKGGVHGATRGIQSEFGERRIFDTSLNEEGIIGRAVGMAIAGLLPVPEIQFRKYLDPATEQVNDIGTVRWRTANQFATPMVVRVPVGFSKKVGDPWHSVCDESILAHKPGWRIAMPSNAEDAAGLLRSALRGNDPTFFLEHRNLLDNSVARRPYPGSDYALPFGVAARVQEGRDLTIVTWGSMVHSSQEAAEPFGDAVEILDLRTIVPWDRESVFASVRRTGRCLIVHEDCHTAGFGAEIGATIAEEAFMDLDAPLRRIAGADNPVPFSKTLMDEVVPTPERIRAAIQELLEF